MLLVLQTMQGLHSQNARHYHTQSIHTISLIPRMNQVHALHIMVHNVDALDPSIQVRKNVRSFLGNKYTQPVQTESA